MSEERLQRLWEAANRAERLVAAGERGVAEARNRLIESGVDPDGDLDVQLALLEQRAADALKQAEVLLEQLNEELGTDRDDA